MPFINLTRPLLDEPNGANIVQFPVPGDEVEVKETRESWSKVQLVGKFGLGWVLSEAIDTEQKFAPDKDIDLQSFARMCWLRSLSSDVPAHYLVAVAKFRSDIVNDRMADEIGPYRLPQIAWDKAIGNAALGLTHIQKSEIDRWDSQCIVFAALAARDMNELQTDIGRQPSAAELYLAHLIGPKAAGHAARQPGITSDAALNGVQDVELPPEFHGVADARKKILTRYAKYLADAGSPIKCSVALDRIAAELKTALDAVKQDVINAGAEVLGVDPAQITTLTNPNTPTPTDPTGGPTTPPVFGSVPSIAGAGGPLGALVASRESGRAGYGAFNRGIAGDSVGKTIDFSQMTIGNIMGLQSLPPGNPNRLFAVGKYQVIPVTMRGAVAKLGINSTEKFGPSLQELVFRGYLVAAKRPSVKAFITGQSSNLRGAQLALAQEFASVADPRTGQSFYAGSGGNHAAISAAQVENAFRQERALFEQLVAQGSSPAQAWLALSPQTVQGPTGSGVASGGGAGVTGIGGAGVLSGTALVGALRQQISAGRITFQESRFEKDLLGLNAGPIKVTSKLQLLVLKLSEIVSPIQISSIIRPGAEGRHGEGRAVDIGNETIANALLPKVVLRVAELNIDEIIFDARIANPANDRQKWNHRRGAPFSFTAGIIADHDDHIHISVDG